MKRPSSGVIFTVASLPYLGAVVAASLHPGPRAWGLHLVGFLGLPGKALVYGLLALGVLASAAGSFISRVPETAPADAAPPVAARDRSAGIKLALLILYGATLWLLRARTHFLGDGMVWISGLREGALPRPAEPLSEGVWQVASAAL